MKTKAAGIPVNFPGLVIIIVLAFVKGELKFRYFFVLQILYYTSSRLLQIQLKLKYKKLARVVQDLLEPLCGRI